MPVNMPGYAFSSIDITPDLGRKFARSEGGLVVTSSRSDPFWRGELVTRALNTLPPNNEHARFLAWLNWVCDMNMRVDFVHPVHQYPSQYDASTWPMTGDAELSSVTDLRTVVVRDLVVGMVLKQGDRVSLMQDDIVVHRWLAEDLVVSSTLAQALPVTPRLPIGILSAGAVVKLEKPPMRLMVVPNSWRAPEEARDEATISFEVSEALR